jgi:hypothetical protein
MVRGSLYTMRGKCGKDNCHCKDGEPHETPALSYSLRGRTHILTLKTEDVPRVRAALDRYKTAREELEDEALAGIERLRSEIRSGRG